MEKDFEIILDGISTIYHVPDDFEFLLTFDSYEEDEMYMNKLCGKSCEYLEDTFIADFHDGLSVEHIPNKNVDLKIKINGEWKNYSYFLNTISSSDLHNVDNVVEEIIYRINCYSRFKKTHETFLKDYNLLKDLSDKQYVLNGTILRIYNDSYIVQFALNNHWQCGYLNQNDQNLSVGQVINFTINYVDVFRFPEFYQEDLYINTLLIIT